MRVLRAGAKNRSLVIAKESAIAGDPLFHVPFARDESPDLERAHRR
jgi:hypothetical protein